MEDLSFEKLNISDWQEQRRLKLLFCKNNPQATCADFEYESSLSDLQWQERLKEQLENNGAFFMAKIGDIFVGMAGVLREKGPKCHHVAVIFNVYVLEEYQGKGIGKKLMEYLMEETIKDESVKKFNLDVTTTQSAAIVLYKNLEFKIVGTLKNEYLVDGKFYDVYEMDKYL